MRRKLDWQNQHYELNARIASLREAMGALEQEHKEHHDNQLAYYAGKTIRLLSLWNQVPSEGYTESVAGGVPTHEWESFDDPGVRCVGDQYLQHQGRAVVEASL